MLLSTRHTLAQWQDNVQLIKLQWELEQEAIVHFEKRLTANVQYRDFTTTIQSMPAAYACQLLCI